MDTFGASCINRRDAKPLYLQVKDLVREQISTGRYKPGDLLASERQLCGLLGISHITVRQALVDLTREGFLLRSQGKGTYVADRTVAPEAITIGLVITEWEGGSYSPFMMELLTGIQSATRERATLSVYSEREARYVADVTAGRLQGVIFLVPHIDHRVAQTLTKQGGAFMVIGDSDVPDVYSVDNDNEGIGETIATHLLDAGHRSIGFIGGPRQFKVTERRLNGYRKTLAAAGVTPSESLERFGNYDADTGSRHAPELAAQGVTALFCADDTIALGAMKALQSQRVKIPEKIAVVGCNDSAFARHTWPPLTTVNTFAEIIGRTSAEILMRVLRKETVPRRTIVTASLIVRESSGRAAGKRKHACKTRTGG